MGDARRTAPRKLSQKQVTAEHRKILKGLDKLKVALGSTQVGSSATDPNCGVMSDLTCAGIMRKIDQVSQPMRRSLNAKAKIRKR